MIYKQLCISLNLCLTYSTVYSVAKIHRPKNHKSAISFVFSDTLTKSLLFVTVSIYSSSLEILVPKKERLLSGDKTIPLNWKLPLLPGHFKYPCVSKSKSSGVFKLPKCFIWTTERKLVGYSSLTRGKDHVQHVGDSPGYIILSLFM